MNYLGIIFLSSNTSQSFIVVQLVNEKLIGADIFGVEFDGSLSALNNGFALYLNVTVPPGVALIQGQEGRSEEYQYQIKDNLPSDYIGKDFVEISTPFGPVNARFQVLRELD